jgi:uncharacterized cupredoxin-like copper-binding protein
MNSFLRSAIFVLALPVRLQAADAWSGAEPITVVMVDNRFQPGDLTLHAGQPYRLRLENHGKELHEFTAPEFLKSATVGNPALLANAGTDIVVQSHHAVEVLLIPRLKGRFGLTCADHDWDGMTGSITVD